VTTVRLPDWSVAPRLGIVLPAEGTPGWTDAAWWAVQLEAWGYPADRLPDPSQASERGTTTLVVAAAAIDDATAAILERALARGTSLLAAGRPSAAAARLLAMTFQSREVGGRLHIDDPDLLVAAGACVPAPGEDGCVVVDPPGRVGEIGPDWTVIASWVGGGAAIAVRPVVDPARPATMAWFGIPADTLDHQAIEVAVLLAEATLDRAAPAGLVGLGRWPDGRPAALVVDGDVDHPTGVAPECARYVAPALETAARAGYPVYGIYVAGANVDAEPGSFPPAEYYNHSHSHPYSHWNARPWDSLDEAEMADEIRRCADAFGRHLGRGDAGMFRLPHFQLEAAERTCEVLDRLGYRAESSVGANVAITGGLPYHPARRPWSERPADLAWARSHPDPAGRFRLLQLPLSSDPMAPDFPNGFCSYNTLGEGVRRRTAAPEAYEILLDEVAERAVARRGLGHVFIDPPDAGYGRLDGDRIDYASAVERWLARCVARDDLAILSTAGLADWWSAREAAIGRVAMRIEARELVVELADPPPGTTLAVLEPAGGEHRRRRRIRMETGPADRAPAGGAT
jgi:peptidoglycan/xylan/chitin deacetylase (PgdA/CDA1 family)